MFTRRENLKQYMQFYPVVSTLIALNIMIYVLTILPIIGDFVFYFGLGSNRLISEGEWWRFVTPMFLHGGLLHLLFNMFSLYLFGPELEKLAGKVRFLTIYFMAGLFGTMVTFLLQDLDYNHVGASGAIYGIFGAFAALVYYARNTMPQLKGIIVPIIVISIIMTFLQPNINITAHLTGLVVGFLIGLSYFHPKRIISWKMRKK